MSDPGSGGSRDDWGAPPSTGWSSPGESAGDADRPADPAAPTGPAGGASPWQPAPPDSAPGQGDHWRPAPPPAQQPPPAGQPPPPGSGQPGWGDTWPPPPEGTQAGAPGGQAVPPPPAGYYPPPQQPPYGQAAPTYGQPPPYGQPAPPYAQYGQYPQYGYGAPQTTDSNAIAALVLSILSWVFCPVLAAIVALVLAGKAKKTIAASQGRVGGEGLVTAARIVSWINIALYGVLLVFLVGALIIGIATDGTDSTNEFGLLLR